MDGCNINALNVTELGNLMMNKDIKRLQQILSEMPKGGNTTTTYMFQMVIEELLFIRKEIEKINSSISAHG